MKAHKPVALAAILGVMIVSGLATAQSPEDTEMAVLEQPGSAEAGEVAVGDVVSLEQAVIVEQPEDYGLALAPEGDRYAIINDMLVRIDPENGKILSILRPVEGQ
ncbi:hypothetical protein JJJ17_04935 [Paracoccus caeni]|uniref:DUF1236 domain-containing protein n=1 Tax=Paracoccus caeni TaxID=657651 RepID=A0A934VXS5_9RHOB|nr:hypothetical protein [Paracoccus caeni]MBK4215267.1 hypothetical protein [Paracoccus caeni]